MSLFTNPYAHYPSILLPPPTSAGNLPDEVAEDSMVVSSTSAEQDDTSADQPDLGVPDYYGPSADSPEDPAFAMLLWHSSITLGNDVNFGIWIAPESDDGTINPDNLDLRGLFQYWTNMYKNQRSGYPYVSQGIVPPINIQDARLYAPTKLKISINDLNDRRCDFQGIDWSVVGATRQATREMRKKTYRNHTNVLPHDNPPLSPSALQSLNVSMRARAKAFHTTVNYFRFRQMHRNFSPDQPHFQLRHTMSAGSQNSVFFANKGNVWCANPQLNTLDCVMKFRKSGPESEVRPIERVSALTASDGVLVIGGYEGNYALKSLSSSVDSPPTLGTLTPQDRILGEGIGYTNHVSTFLDRRSGLPQAVFSNNDHYVRTLDCHSDRLIRAHNYGWAVNCTATSPDGRLRVIVGDTCSPWIVDAEKGDKIVRLTNHTDFGFACAWSPNGRHVATGNQDRIVQIWDSRAWNQPLEVLSTELAGVRSLHFSPLGGGKPVLLMAEPADFVSVVNAQTFQSRQQFDFFGEIGGVSFTPDGSKFFVANTDGCFGGILEFDRVGDCGSYRRRRREHFEWAAMDEPSSEDDGKLADMDSISTRAHRTRCGFELGDLII
ncbi:hypothetical protein MMC07_002634 [Pseudocyphellaria aurata]|nr:hypothetical protein [Pseudocyphellaria aurata]